MILGLFKVFRTWLKMWIFILRYFCLEHWYPNSIISSSWLYLKEMLIRNRIKHDNLYTVPLSTFLYYYFDWVERFQIRTDRITDQKTYYLRLDLRSVSSWNHLDEKLLLVCYYTLWITEAKRKKTIRAAKLPKRKHEIPIHFDKIWEFRSKIQCRCGMPVDNTLKTWNVSSNDSDTDRFRETLMVHWPI